MSRLYTLAMLAVLMPTFAFSQNLQDLVGQWAKYVIVPAGGASGTAATHVTLSLPALEEFEGAGAIWFQMEVLESEERVFAIALLVPSVEFLSATGSQVDVLRYVLFPAERPAVEYVDRVTNRALTPGFSFFEFGLPHALDVLDTSMPLFEQGSFRTAQLTRVEGGEGALLLPIEEAKRLTLDPDLLVGCPLLGPQATLGGVRLYSNEYYDLEPRPAATEKNESATMSQSDYHEASDRRGDQLARSWEDTASVCPGGARLLHGSQRAYARDDLSQQLPRVSFPGR